MLFVLSHCSGRQVETIDQRSKVPSFLVPLVVQEGQNGEMINCKCFLFEFCVRLFAYLGGRLHESLTRLHASVSHRLAHRNMLLDVLV